MSGYKDPKQSIDLRVADLLSKMSIKEKVGQLNQKMHGWNAYKVADGEVELTQAYHNEVAFGDGLGAIYGIFRADGWNSHLTMGIKKEESIKVVNEIQRYVIEHTRLGIPVLIAEECPHGHEALEATTFPTNIGIGSTWNPDLYRQECGVIAKELRARGGHLALISTLDIATDPRWGRTEECFSEDPILAGRFSEAAVLGLQGTDVDQLKEADRVGAVVKHFCAQGATIGGHNGKSTNIGQRELHEIHLHGMAMAAKAGACSCMAAYNDIDGVPCHINRSLLTDILRDQMGFEGFVMSDGCGVDRLDTITGSPEKSGAYAVHAGVDMNLWNNAFLTLESAFDKGYLSSEDLDTAVARILRVKFAMGLFEHPYVQLGPAKDSIGSKASREMALKVAREVAVLLKNDGVLPIKKSVKSIAVIGPNSHNLYNMLGDYTQWKEEGQVVTVLEGIKNHASEECKVTYTQGCGVRGMSKEGFKEAIELAQAADLVVLVLGGSSSREPGMTFEDNGAVFMNEFTSEIDCGEAVDLADIRLGGVQEDLAKEIKAVGKPMVTLLIEGRPHAVPWFEENANALMSCWYPGEQGGNAIGEILFGKTVPSGKLSMSIAKSSSQLPVYYNRKDMSKYVDMEAKPLYPFGYGLSYTSFKYDDFRMNETKLSASAMKKGQRFEVSFRITNEGSYDGKEVAQLYIYDMESCITRRIKELKDFTKVAIGKGLSRDVTLSVGLEELSIYDYTMDFTLEAGNVKLMVGSSSEAIHYETVVEIL